MYNIGGGKMKVLKINNLTVSVDNKIVLQDFNLIINPGEIIAIMGPNGVGKSTLSKVIMGDSSYKIEKGTIEYNGIILNDKSVDERANLGLFLAVQMPLEIEGVTNSDLLRTAVHLKEGDSFKLFDFIKELNKNIKNLQMSNDMIHRSVNVGFSGGERKKNEILQMYMLKPSFIILDEIDSGLDVDSLKLIGKMIMNYYQNHNCSILIITHYQRVLDFIKPNFINILSEGRIILKGDISLVKEIETKGYDYIKNNLSRANKVKGNNGNE